MHPAAKFQFERTAREFSQWRAVPEEDRSPAPAWWWQPAIEVVAQHEEMAALLCYRLQLPIGSTYAAGAAVLMATLADQTSLPWPDEFPRKIKRGNDLVALDAPQSAQTMVIVRCRRLNHPLAAMPAMFRGISLGHLDIVLPLRLP